MTLYGVMVPTNVEWQTKYDYEFNAQQRNDLT